MSDKRKPILELSTKRPADDDAEGWRRYAEELERELTAYMARETHTAWRGLFRQFDFTSQPWWKRAGQVLRGRESAAKRKAKRLARDKEIGDYAVGLARGSELADNPKGLVSRVQAAYPRLKKSTLRRILSEQHVATRLRDS